MIEKIIDYIKNFNQDEIDDKYQEYLTKVRSMTGAGVVQLLNGCVSLIDEDKCYLEIGTHRGSTLLGAALENKAKCYGVDTFLGHNNKHEIAPFASVEEGLQDAISRLSSGNVQYFKSCYKEFFKDRVDVEGQKVEVYFYDGDHMSDNQYLGLSLSLPVLADHALVLVDDSAFQDRGHVWYGINRAIKDNVGFSLLREFTPTQKNHLEGMWQGVVALEYKKV